MLTPEEAETFLESPDQCQVIDKGRVYFRGEVICV